MDSQYQIDIISAMAERTIKRLWILIIILVVLLFGSNVAWIIYESSFVDEVVTVEAKTDTGGPAIANTTGRVIFNGVGESDNENPQEEVREGDRIQEMP